MSFPDLPVTRFLLRDANDTVYLAEKKWDAGYGFPLYRLTVHNEAERAEEAALTHEDLAALAARYGPDRVTYDPGVLDLVTEVERLRAKRTDAEASR